MMDNKRLLIWHVHIRFAILNIAIFSSGLRACICGVQEGWFYFSHRLWDGNSQSKNPLQDHVWLNAVERVDISEGWDNSRAILWHLRQVLWHLVLNVNVTESRITHEGLWRLCWWPAMPMFLFGLTQMGKPTWSWTAPFHWLDPGLDV